jgi:chromate transport protein ChrA
MTLEELNDARTLCQLLSGSNVVNLSVVFGRRIGGAAHRTHRRQRLCGGIGGCAQFYGNIVMLATGVVSRATRLNPLWILPQPRLLASPA